jgi:hypothetical protein
LKNRVSARIAERASIAAASRAGQFAHFLDWPLGTVVVTGPKTLDFDTAFCNHRATSLKADGKDILSVRMILNSGVDADANVAEINP